MKFERTVWAERQIAKLCPNNNIANLGDVLATEDLDEQMENIERLIIIMNEAYERKAHFLDPSHEMEVVTKEYLENLNEEELMALANEAFADFAADGEQEIQTEPKKEKAEQTESM